MTSLSRHNSAIFMTMLAVAAVKKDPLVATDGTAFTLCRLREDVLLLYEHLPAQEVGVSLSVVQHGVACPLSPGQRHRYSTRCATMLLLCQFSEARARYPLCGRPSAHCTGHLKI